jgi:porphobilinogen synthase
MPGQFQLSADLAAREAREAKALGIPAVILFGIPEKKDELGSGAYDSEGVVQRAIRAIKAKAPGLLVIADCCLCEYTSHGHCGAVVKHAGGKGAWTVDNDATLDLIARTALSQAQAGADVIAPSGMMDGMVGAIRRALDEDGKTDRLILSYAVKYASAFYGPFRQAAEGAPRFGDRRTYQMDPANAREALREAAQDAEEGADILMVKPALGCLDIVRGVRERFSLPVAAYNVSGEYAMVKAAARNGWLDEESAVLEILTAIRRAGADLLVTYHAKEVARL